jgi:glycosyl transferase family 87
VQAAQWRRFGLVAIAAVLAAVFLFGTARAVSPRYHDDTLWANTVASLGGTVRPGDFGYVFLPAANDVLAGRNPYMDPDEFVGRPQAPYAYPPVVALAVTPLAVLPETARGTFVPGVLFTLLLIGATVAGLRLLEVRDWRCYPIALLYPFTLEAFEYGAVGPVLFLLIALAWHYRDRLSIAAGSIGLAVALKLFLWPLFAWLAVTRRVATAVVAVAVAGALALGSWLVIGFRGLGDYPRLLDKLVDVEATNSYSLFAILRTVGIGERISQFLVVALGVLLLVFAWHAARASRSSARDRDRRSLTLVLAAALVMTPILRLHYLVLLVVPIALARPRLSPLWAIPLVATVFEAIDWYRGWPSGDGEALVSVAVIVTLVFTASLRTGGLADRQRKPAPAGAH